MDAAAAALMSDRERNPLFRRRWEDGDERVVPRPAVPSDVIWESLDSLDLLRAWRRERERRT